MTERPILFSGELVRAVLGGRKTVTRRPVTKSTSSGPDWVWRHSDDGVETISGASAAWDELDFSDSRWGPFKDGDSSGDGEYLHVPANDHQTRHRVYCRTLPRDVLWVRETWAWLWGDADHCHCEDGVLDCGFCPEHDYVEYRAEADAAKYPGGWDGAAEHDDIPVRWKPSIHMPRWACRLTLRVTDVRAERVQEIDDEDAAREGVIPIRDTDPSAREMFASLWDSIYKSKPGLSWDDNPWVWRIEFEANR